MPSCDEIFSIDIGSTYTKGIKVSLGDGGFVETYAVTPTTINDLSKGFCNVLATLAEVPVSSIEELTCGRNIRFSSSAKGGLKIVAIGLVPELTLKVARLTACSAGGKLLKTFSYRLNESDIAEIESLEPDIILLAGGSDGGNAIYPIENARKLANSQTNAVIIYAGNRDLTDEIAKILSNKIFQHTENVMPEIGMMNPEPARSIIRKAFIEQIASGKGLSEIVRAIGQNPKPTPLAMFELVQAIGEKTANLNIMLIDMGGATTDIYSYCESFTGDQDAVLRGIREPKLKRSVEGDLGMRVSAKSIWQSASSFCDEELKLHNFTEDDFVDYLEKITSNPNFLPAKQDAKFRTFDTILARSCLQFSITRHAGTFTPTHTLQGKVNVQFGKDLRAVSLVIGTGGYLSHCADENLWNNLGPIRTGNLQEVSLWPNNFEYWIDQHYLYPLLANIVQDFPKIAVNIAQKSITKIAQFGTGKLR